ncbi:hypothetical protein [Antarctobacter sp.]|uniref:hypothetical protein n=1 Tax=Antarctobacter sp. TaxID=1872577 RepID=UPI002B268173|nr:hypothetical protein [Antarctobacter sp.]
MAVFSFLLSSVIGLACALTGWLAYDMSLFAAFGLHLSVSLLVGTALVVAVVHAHDSAGREVEA